MTIDTRKLAPKVEVDNRIPLRNYYRIADNILRQASIYRDENNVIELYIILLRYLSLVSETIPYHRDYHLVNTKEKTTHKKRSFAILDELESLKPEFERKLEQQRLENTSNGSEIQSTEWRNFNKNAYLSTDIKQPAVALPHSSWRYDEGNAEGIASSSSQVDTQFNKLSISLPRPKQDTLSRHSFLGPNGLKGQWLGPRPDIKVQYPTNNDLASSENSSLEKAAQYGVVASLDGNSVEVGSTMESVLSLDDGRWLYPAEQSCPTLINDAREDPLQFVGIRQPSPPPVLAKVHQEFAQIPPSKVADPRPGPAKTSQNGMPSLKSYQHLHVPVNLMVDFLRLAQKNTERNLETCAVLAGSLKNKVFHITTLIVPKQESTSDSCQTLNEEEIFEVQDRLSLFPLGWIHTHPTQTCFMSSVDLHTHYSYQIMLPEAVAIVMAPTDESSPHGIFHLSDPGGVSVIRNCQERGFHPHEEPSDGSPIYEHCSHVYMNSRMKVDVVDLR